VLSRLFLLLALVPLAEIWLLMELAEKTSWLTTIAVVLSTGVIGISLVRWQGIKTIQEIQRSAGRKSGPAAGECRPSPAGSRSEARCWLLEEPSRRCKEQECAGAG